MNQKRVSAIWVMIIAIVLVAAAVFVGWLLFRSDQRLLRDATVEQSVITPNADGKSDATSISYELSRNADVSIYFENDEGERFYFRHEQPRGVGDYQVLFSGVVQGYLLPDEEIEGDILNRLLQDGEYVWHIEATDETGHSESASGQLSVTDADTILPELRNFSLDRHTFSPNQDGIDDRVLIQFFLPKETTQTRVFLVTPEGSELPVAERERGVEPGMPGRHEFDYEGGVDNNATPPADGTYPVIAIAEDAEGQRIRVEDSLAIEFGGVPRAEIISPPVGDTVSFSSTAVALCDSITFTLTVQNYGTTPLRTTGPSPGTVYDSDWNYNRLGWETESGAWRVAIGYENELSNYPYRWAIGNRDDLEKIGDHYYLMPGQRAVVSGTIRLTSPFGERNPQPVWAGLIHEDVEISQFNNRVDPHSILVDIVDPDQLEECGPQDSSAAKPSFAE